MTRTTQTSVSPPETKRIAEALAHALNGGEIILLFGELGVGKTVFVKGLAHGLGIDDRDVTSPSFTLMNSYQGRLTLHHIDLYRLSSLREIDALGLDDFIGQPRTLTAIEWGERVETVTWDGTIIRVHLTYGKGDAREISVRGEEGIKHLLGGFNEEPEAPLPRAERRS